MAEKCSALAREGHTAPQAASGLPLKHNLITDASFFPASGGEDGKAWPEREQAAQTCSAQVAQTWSGSWRLGQSHWVLVVTWSFYFGGISLVLAMQFPVYVPCMQVTLPLVPKQAHSCTSSISASGVQVVYRYHYPAPQSLH